MKLLSLTLLSIGLASAGTVFQDSQLSLPDQEASQFLSRSKRGLRMGGWREKMRSSNKERECIEKTCDPEELTEYLENISPYDEMDRDDLYIVAVHQVEEIEKKKTCPTFGFQKHSSKAELDQEVAAFTHDKDGFCTEPIDICQYYESKGKARCSDDKNSFCKNLNTEKRNDSSEYGISYVGYECVCKEGFVNGYVASLDKTVCVTEEYDSLNSYGDDEDNSEVYDDYFDSK